jgi:HlyD family secretion protein
MKRRLLWSALVIVVLVAGATVYFFTRPEAAADAAGRTARVTKTTHDVIVRSQGLIVSGATIEVKSRASGLVQAVHASAGDRVRKDQVLLEVDPARSRLNEEEMRNEVENARSQVRIAEDAIDPERAALAKRKLDRVHELAKQGLTTREAIEQGEYDLAAAERALRNQKQQLEAAQRRLEVSQTRLRRAETESAFTIIRSPIDGVVLSRTAEVGSGVTSFSDSAQGGTVLFKIGSLDRLAFDGSLAISDLTKVRSGLKARVVSDAWKTTTSGTVTYVGQEAIAQGQSASTSGRAPTFQVKVQLDAAASNDLPLNVPASAEIIVETITNALVVPVACVRHLPNSQGLLRELSGGVVRDKTVKLGAVTAGMVQVTGDIAEGTELAGCTSTNAIPTRGI